MNKLSLSPSSRGILWLLLVQALLIMPCRNNLAANAANWPQFRGPGAKATSDNKDLPEHWSATENVEWVAEIPGRGWASPITWGSRVFIFTVVSTGTVEAPKKGLYLGGERPNVERPEHQWKLICLELASGKTLWDRTIQRGTPLQPVHLKNTYASETPVTDGDSVYVYVGNFGLFCLNMEGEQIWSKPMLAHKMRYGWGKAASPTLYQDRLFIVDDNDEESCLLALDKRTGKEVWRIPRDEKSNWSTPFVWATGEGAEVVTAGTGKVRSYSLEGKLLWSLEGMSSITIATPYADNDLLYVSSGFIADKLRPVYAIKPSARGDITLAADQTNNAGVAWCQRTAAPYNPTTLVYEGLLYVLHDRGELSAYDSRTGAMIYDRQKLPAGLHFTASPWAYKNRVFCLNEDGVTFVVRSGKTFELLDTNKLPGDEMYMASPAMAGDRLLIRSTSRLFCIRNR